MLASNRNKKGGVPKYVHISNKEDARRAVKNSPENFIFIGKKLLDDEFINELALLVMQIDPSYMPYFRGLNLNRDMLDRLAHINPTECIKSHQSYMPEDIIRIAIMNDPLCINHIKKPSRELVDFAECVAREMGVYAKMKRRI